MNKRYAFTLGFLLLFLTSFWFGASVHEMRTGQRVFPWSPYDFCGTSKPDALPKTVSIGLYEEFPVPWRLNKLEQVDFPITLAVAASSRAEFLELRKDIQQKYPQVREIYFWPLLSKDEGYYPGSWSDAEGVRRVAREANDLPTLWDLEMPLYGKDFAIQNWWDNRSFVDQWLSQRGKPVHIWRSHTSMGLDPLFLRVTAMHFDPLIYPEVSLHLDLYTIGEGRPEEEMKRILRCGVEKYGSRFIPSMGSLNDKEGPDEIFLPSSTLRRDLRLAREAGVSEIWLFQVNGLNADYLAAVKETLPLESSKK